MPRRVIRSKRKTSSRKSNRSVRRSKNRSVQRNMKRSVRRNMERSVRRSKNRSLRRRTNRSVRRNEKRDIKRRTKRNKKNRTNNKKIRLLIRDEETGIKKYTARINNEWALFEYEPKKSLIQFKPDDFIQLKEENKLFIVVEDLLGNKTIYNETIYYKP